MSCCKRAAIKSIETNNTFWGRSVLRWVAGDGAWVTSVGQQGCTHPQSVPQVCYNCSTSTPCNFWHLCSCRESKYLGTWNEHRPLYILPHHVAFDDLLHHTQSNTVRLDVSAPSAFLGLSNPRHPHTSCACSAHTAGMPRTNGLVTVAKPYSTWCPGCSHASSRSKSWETGPTNLVPSTTQFHLDATLWSPRCRAHFRSV